jgi:hypothetical protein
MFNKATRIVQKSKQDKDKQISNNKALSSDSIEGNPTTKKV